MDMQRQNVCPLCTSALITLFVSRPRVPAVMNTLCPTQALAFAVPLKTLELAVCETCGFVFNQAFTGISYDVSYDNAQEHAAFFQRYLDDLVADLVRQGVEHCHVLEIGCGKQGTFLTKLVEAGHNYGHGFDPSYAGPATQKGDHLQFETRYYDETVSALPTDVVICRHVLEHIPDPVRFLRTIRQALLSLTPSPRIYFETPDIAWSLHNHAIADLYYEHCSYFSEQTLAFAFERAGFTLQTIRKQFSSQYLWCEVAIAEQPVSSEPTPGGIPALARQYQHEETRIVHGWMQVVQNLAQAGSVALLGAAGKGVTFANLIDPQRKMITCVIDVNPTKHYGYIPSTGHPIIPYEEAEAYGITSAILMNPNYYAETVTLFNKHHLKIKIISDRTVVQSVQKHMKIQDLKGYREAHMHQRIVLTNGVFDLLHPGHLDLLALAKSSGDILVVALESNESVRRLKGQRPIQTEQDRLCVLSSLEMVDAVVLFEGDQLREIIHALTPALYIKGSDSIGKSFPFEDALKKEATQIVVMTPKPGKKRTSDIIEQIARISV